MTELPKPECRMGFPVEQINAWLGDGASQQAFWDWTYGQTMSICTGELYNHDTGEYEQDCPDPHGPVVYEWDLRRYIDGRPIVD